MKSLLLIPINLLQELLRKVLFLLMALMFLFAVMHRLGFIKRFIHRFAETELSKVLNGARVTIADVEVDLLLGHADITDLVVHTPQRDEWGWDSPLIVRCGKLKVDFNLLSVIDYISDITGHPCKEIYSVVVEDVQFFVEKRRNVFNFHLLDESLDLPDPKILLDVKKDNPSLSVSSTSTSPADGIVISEIKPNKVEISAMSSPNSCRTLSVSKVDKNPERTTCVDVAESVIEKGSIVSKTQLRYSSPDGAEKKANEIVTSMLGAVSSLGRAANEGGKEGLEKAIRNHKDGFVSRLKQFQATVGSSFVEETSNPRTLNRKISKNSMEMIAMEGMKVMKQMGKAVEKNVSDIQQQMDAFKKPPQKKKDWVGPELDDMFRFGRIVGREIRIFTKDIILSSSGGSASSTPGSSSVCASGDDGISVSKKQNSSNGSTQRKRSSSTRTQRPPNASGWSRPILLKVVSLSSAELCPPASAKDEEGMPPIGQKIEKIVDIVIMKMVSEMAKTNTGRLFQTAVGEVFAWMDQLKVNTGSAAKNKLGI